MSTTMRAGRSTRHDTGPARSGPGGEHDALQDAAHSSVHLDRPDAVLQAIGDLLDRVDRRPQLRRVAAAGRGSG
jgi:hypothetical protein